MSLPQFSQGGILHGGFPLGEPEGGDVHQHSWYDENGNLVRDQLTARLGGGAELHVPILDRGFLPPIGPPTPPAYGPP